MKTQYAKEKSVQSSKVRFLFNGTEMDDSVALGSYNIKENGAITVAI